MTDQIILNEMIDLKTAKGYDFAESPQSEWSTDPTLKYQAEFKTDTGVEYAFRAYTAKKYGTHTRTLAFMRKKDKNYSKNISIDPSSFKKVLVTFLRCYELYKTTPDGIKSSSFVISLQSSIKPFATLLVRSLERAFRSNGKVHLNLAGVNEEAKDNSMEIFCTNPISVFPYFGGNDYDEAAFTNNDTFKTLAGVVTKTAKAPVTFSSISQSPLVPADSSTAVWNTAAEQAGIQAAKKGITAIHYDTTFSELLSASGSKKNIKAMKAAWLSGWNSVKTQDVKAVEIPAIAPIPTIDPVVDVPVPAAVVEPTLPDPMNNPDAYTPELFLRLHNAKGRDDFAAILREFRVHRRYMQKHFQSIVEFYYNADQKEIMSDRSIDDWNEGMGFYAKKLDNDLYNFVMVSLAHNTSNVVRSLELLKSMVGNIIQVKSQNNTNSNKLIESIKTRQMDYIYQVVIASAVPTAPVRMFTIIDNLIADISSLNIGFNTFEFVYTHVNGQDSTYTSFEDRAVFTTIMMYKGLINVKDALYILSLYHIKFEYKEVDTGKYALLDYRENDLIFKLIERYRESNLGMLNGEIVSYGRVQSDGTVEQTIYELFIQSYKTFKMAMDNATAVYDMDLLFSKIKAHVLSLNEVDFKKLVEEVEASRYSRYKDIKVFYRTCDILAEYIDSKNKIEYVFLKKTLIQLFVFTEHYKKTKLNIASVNYFKNNVDDFYDMLLTKFDYNDINGFANFEYAITAVGTPSNISTLLENFIVARKTSNMNAYQGSYYNDRYWVKIFKFHSKEYDEKLTKLLIDSSSFNLGIMVNDLFKFGNVHVINLLNGGTLNAGKLTPLDFMRFYYPEEKTIDFLKALYEATDSESQYKFREFLFDRLTNSNMKLSDVKFVIGEAHVDYNITMAPAKYGKAMESNPKHYMDGLTDAQLNLVLSSLALDNRFNRGLNNPTAFVDALDSEDAWERLDVATIKHVFDVNNTYSRNFTPKSRRPYEDANSSILLKLHEKDSAVADNIFSTLEANDKKAIAKSIFTAKSMMEAKNKILGDDVAIKPLVQVDEKRIKQILKYNEISMGRVPTVKVKDTFSSILQKPAGALDLHELKIVEGRKNQEEVDRLTIEYDAFNKYKHGDIAIKFLREFSVNIPIQEKGFNDWVQKLTDESKDVNLRKPMFHGTGSVAASMILRYGFKVLKSNDPSVVGRALGDGIYITNVLDKVAQYVSDYGYLNGKRGIGAKGYIFEMEAALGTYREDYTACGPGSGHNENRFVSPEWAVFRPNSQLKIYKAYEVEVVDKSIIPELKSKYGINESKSVLGITQFRSFLHEATGDGMKHKTTYIFVDGDIPISETESVDFEQFDPSVFGRHVQLDQSGSGPTVIIENDEASEIFCVRYTSDMMKDKEELTKFLKLLRNQ